MKRESEIQFSPFETAECAKTFPDHMFREIACNLCGSGDATVLFTETPYCVKKCVSCGLVYMSPQPTREALDEYYARFYPTDDDETVTSWNHKSSFRQMRRILRRYHPQGGRLLDVGCGFGLFLETLGHEWELTGLDPNGTACERARRAVPRASIIHGDLDSMATPTDRFDAVTLMATLDHMDDPTSALRRIGTMLKPGGVILIRGAYLEAYFKLKRVMPWLPIRSGAPRRLFDFSPRTIGLILERNGYRIARLYVGSREHVSRATVAAAVLALKTVSKIGYYASGRRWFMPFCGSIVAVAFRTDDSTTDGPR